MAIIDYLRKPKGANKNKKRRGLGRGSGHGKTACRGHKGQTARGNTKKYKGVEGGQMPLARRLPKRGFVNRNKKAYQLVALKKLSSFSGKEPVTPGLLKGKGFIRNEKSLVKILSTEKFKNKLEIHAHAFSKAAKSAIEQAGGKALLIGGNKKTKEKKPAVKSETKE